MFEAPGRFSRDLFEAFLKEALGDLDAQEAAHNNFREPHEHHRDHDGAELDGTPPQPQPDAQPPAWIPL